MAIAQTPPQTPTEILVALCQDILAGNSGRAKELEALLNQRTSEMNQGLAHFVGKTQEQGESFEERFSEEIEYVEMQFTAYDEALKKIGQFLQDKNGEHLKGGVAMVEQAARNLSIAMARYEEKFLAEGSSRFAQVNFLNNLAQSVRAKKTSMDAFETACDRFCEQYRGMVAEIDNSAAKDKPGVPERRQAAHAIAEIVDSLPETLAQNGDLAPSFENLTARLSDLEQAFATYNANTLLSGETQVAQANLVLNTGRDFIAGRGQREIFESAARGYKNEVSRALLQVKSLASQAVEPGVLQTETARCIENLEILEDALDEVITSAAGSVAPHSQLQECLDEIACAVKELYSAKVAIDDYNNKQGMVTCPSCGSNTPIGSKHCHSCKRVVPQQALSFATSSVQFMEGAEFNAQSEDQPIVTAFMKEIYETTLAYVEGKGSLEQVQGQISEHTNRLEHTVNQLRAYKPLEVPEGLSEEEQEHLPTLVDLPNQVLEVFQSGSEMCRDGLDKMQSSLPDNHSGLESGLRTYFQGLQHLFKVEKMAKEFDQGILGAIAEKMEMSVEDLEAELERRNSGQSAEAASEE